MTLADIRGSGTTSWTNNWTWIYINGNGTTNSIQIGTNIGGHYGFDIGGNGQNIVYADSGSRGLDLNNETSTNGPDGLLFTIPGGATLPHAGDYTNLSGGGFVTFTANTNIGTHALDQVIMYGNPFCVCQQQIGFQNAFIDAHAETNGNVTTRGDGILIGLGSCPCSTVWLTWCRDALSGKCKFSAYDVTTHALISESVADMDPYPFSSWEILFQTGYLEALPGHTYWDNIVLSWSPGMTTYPILPDWGPGTTAPSATLGAGRFGAWTSK